MLHIKQESCEYQLFWVSWPDLTRESNHGLQTMRRTLCVCITYYLTVNQQFRAPSWIAVLTVFDYKFSVFIATIYHKYAFSSLFQEIHIKLGNKWNKQGYGLPERDMETPQSRKKYLQYRLSLHLLVMQMRIAAVCCIFVTSFVLIEPTSSSSPSNQTSHWSSSSKSCLS